MTTVVQFVVALGCRAGASNSKIQYDTSMRRHLVLHTGHVKTGSSAIQAFCHINSEWLGSKGVGYPHGPEAPTSRTHISSGNGAFLYTFLVMGRGWDAFIEQLDSVAEPTVLISSEWLHEATADRILELRSRLEERGYQIRAVTLIREPVSWYLGAYAQRVKRHGAVEPFDQFCQQWPFTQYKTVQAYDEALGRDRHRVLSYEAANREVVPYFLRYGLDMDSLDDIPQTKLKSVNRSLTHRELTFLRRINRGTMKFGLDSSRRVRTSTRISDAMIVLRPNVPPEHMFRAPLPETTVAAIRDQVSWLNDRLEFERATED